LAWLNNDRSSSTIDTTDNIWLKFPPVTNIGDQSEVKMRVLGGDPKNADEPAGVWVHWLSNRPLNCRGIEDCPVCRDRMHAKRDDPEGYKTRFPMNYKYFFNVLVEEEGKPIVKVFSFGNGVGKVLKTFAAKYGDLRTYDITVQKTKMGKDAKLVEYSVFYEGKRELTDVEASAAVNVHDLTQFTAAGTQEQLDALNAPTEQKSVENVNTEDMTTSGLLVEIEDKCKAKGLELAHFGVTPDTPRTLLESLLRDLSSD
jgi:hypothetical protein